MAGRKEWRVGLQLPARRQGWTGRHDLDGVDRKGGRSVGLWFRVLVSIYIVPGYKHLQRIGFVVLMDTCLLLLP